MIADAGFDAIDYSMFEIWDNGVFDGSNKDGEKFGFFNRRTLKWQFPEILEAINTTVEEVDN